MICFIVTANDKIYYIDNLKETRVKIVYEIFQLELFYYHFLEVSL